MEQGDRKSLRNVELNNINRFNLIDTDRTPSIQDIRKQFFQVLLKWSIYQNKLCSVQENQSWKI